MECGHESLKNPVFLSNGGHYGAGCASQLLGLPDRKVVKLRDELLTEAQRLAAIDADRLARYQAALAQFETLGVEVVQQGGLDFNVLRRNHSQVNPDLNPPRAFAAYLAARIAVLKAGCPA